jgi:uroporphyrinogen-III synthase
MVTPDLAGVHVVVTRPSHQAQDLCKLIESCGGKVIQFPVLEIADPEDLTPFWYIVDRLDVFDLAIFVSANAVERGIALIESRRPLPPHLQLACVGMATTRALEAQGLKPDIQPHQRFDSEGLLALDELQDVSDKRIIIFRGEGGRELLADTLKERGATVEYAECYRRVKPDIDGGQLVSHWEDDTLDVIIITSNEALNNLYELVGLEGRDYLLNTPMVVISERTKKLAQELGVKQIPIVAPQASDDGLLSALKEWHSKH